ncbi:uncharacterized protein LOC143218726 [Lasioglossum baleicum]|uniref:uncharacterized protein LOC143218726 n=1 Tax=Lasioglossum baleicum TaxID=434251 RepID=UPI003FCEC119
MFGEDGSKSVVFALVVLMFFYGGTSSKCTQQTPCLCMFPDGQGYNLTQLATSGPLTARVSNTNTSYFQFQPCMNAQMNVTKDSPCGQGKGVSMCLVDGNTSISLGTVQETSMEISPEPSKSSLVLLHNNYTTKVGLLCCDNCATHLVADPIKDKLNYHLMLVSKFACKEQLRSNHGLSTGSLLVIYFFIFTGTYFVGGAIALNLLRGARGWEMVPNHKFWRDLPSLVRDGIEYTFGCCYSSSYNRI